MLNHTGIKPSENSIDKLVSEVRNVNNNELPLIINKTTFECSECVFKCIDKCDLLKHLKSHNIFACDKCEYRNSSLHGLNGHIKIHGNKKLNCTMCDFKGTSVSTLNAHMEKHMDDQIYSASQTSKRDLSVSPEVLNINKKQKAASS